MNCDSSKPPICELGINNRCKDTDKTEGAAHKNREETFQNL